MGNGGNTILHFGTQHARFTNSHPPVTTGEVVFFLHSCSSPCYWEPKGLIDYTQTIDSCRSHHSSHPTKELESPRRLWNPIMMTTTIYVHTDMRFRPVAVYPSLPYISNRLPSERKDASHPPRLSHGLVDIHPRASLVLPPPHLFHQVEQLIS